MNPEYTNPITTVRHPRFGSLRIIHIDGKPWLCLADVRRIFTSTKSSWAEAVLSSRQLRHTSGHTFLSLSLTAACLAAPRDGFLDWLLSIVLTSGRTGPTPFREHPGPHQDLVSRLAVDASWIHAFTDSSTPYDDWVQNRKAQLITVRSEEKAGSFQFPNNRFPLVAGAEEFVRTGNLEMSWVAKMVIMEALNGWHTQDSLDHAMTLCSKLLPDPPDRIDARAVHAFLEIPESFPVWFNERVYRRELIHGKDYFSSDGSRFLPAGDVDTASEAVTYFAIETAKAMMMQARTPRGSSTRQYFIGVAKKAEASAEMSGRAKGMLSNIVSDLD